MQQRGAVGDGFDALGNHAPFEGTCQPDHAFQNGAVICVLQHVLHKALVNFERGNVQALQVGERRVAGAKIVQRKRNANLLAGLNHAGHLCHVLQRAGLQYFQLQAGRQDPWVRRQNALQALHKIALLQLACANVDADRQVQPSAAPLLDLV